MGTFCRVVLAVGLDGRSGLAPFSNNQARRGNHVLLALLRALATARCKLDVARVENRSAMKVVVALSVARRSLAAGARDHVCGPKPPFLRHRWSYSCCGGRGDQGQRLLAAGPSLRLRRAGAQHRRRDDEVPPRQAPRDLVAGINGKLDEKDQPPIAGPA